MSRYICVPLFHSYCWVLLGSLRSRGAPPLATLWPNLLAGSCLLLALRLALGQASWQWLALVLAVSLLAHLLDLRQRWRRLPQGARESR